MHVPSLRHLPLLLLSLIATFPVPSSSASSRDVPPIKINQSFLKPDANVPSHPVQHVLEHTPKDDTWSCPCHLSGPIDATQCDYETMESATEVLFDRLDRLVKTPFFKYYKVDLLRECPFWQENGFCMQRSCAVEGMDESEIPENYRAEALSRVQSSSRGEAHQYPGCYYRDSDFCFLDDESSEDSQYIDLTLNNEAFTGYAGESAHRVWSAIYDENCFGMRENDLPDTEDAPAFGSSIAPLALESKTKLEEEGECTEKRAYYRIISGMHASISTHLCYEYLDQSTGEWGPNLPCFVRRVASHPERLQHIYFNTVLLLRALTRVAPYLSAYDIRTGDNLADGKSKQILASVVDVAKRVGKFDERKLFKGENANLLKEQFKAHFRNVSLIMDCVGCDKCRLWGKIQTSGVGTALKILFELDDRALNPKVNPNLLQRSEIVAMINTLHRFVESLHMTGKFREMWAESEGKGRVLDDMGDGDEVVPMKEEQNRDLRFTAESARPSYTSVTMRQPVASPRADGLSAQEQESIYTRLGELLQECSEWSFSACANLVKVIVDLAGKVASVLGGSGKEGAPVMADREL